MGSFWRRNLDLAKYKPSRWHTYRAPVGSREIPPLVDNPTMLSGKRVCRSDEPAAWRHDSRKPLLIDLEAKAAGVDPRLAFFVGVLSENWGEHEAGSLVICFHESLAANIFAVEIIHNPLARL